MSWNRTLFSNRAWRLLNLKNDAKADRIKAQTHPWKTNEFFLSVKTSIGGPLKMKNHQTLVLANKKQWFFLWWHFATYGKKKRREQKMQRCFSLQLIISVCFKNIYKEKMQLCFSWKKLGSSRPKKKGVNRLI